jgi:hypothetical protein
MKLLNSLDEFNLSLVCGNCENPLENQRFVEERKIIG